MAGQAPSPAALRVARLPDGNPLSSIFLSTVLLEEVIGFEVDETSIIEGRHSATFRLRLKYRNQGTSICGGSVTPDTVYVKRMVCRDLPPRPLHKWRMSIASYRAETSFFQNLSDNDALGNLAPRCFWVHCDDRLHANMPIRNVDLGQVGGSDVSWGKSRCDEDMDRRLCTEAGVMREEEEEEERKIDALRESSFMLITEDLGRGDGWEQVGAMSPERAKQALSSMARFHAIFWGTAASLLPPSSTTSVSQEGNNPTQTLETNVDRPGGEGGFLRGSTHRDNCDAGKSKQLQDQEGSYSSGVEGHKLGRVYAPGLHEHGTFWSLNKREVRDLSEMEETYAALVKRLRSGLPGLFDRQGAMELGRRLATRARELDDEASGRLSYLQSGERGEIGMIGDGAVTHRDNSITSVAKAGVRNGSGVESRARDDTLCKSGDDDMGEVRDCSTARRGSKCAVSGRWGRCDNRHVNGRTLLHGDPKTWNMFFKMSNGGVGNDGAGAGGVKFIDWQWCGEGLACSDVAYMMCTSLEPKTLELEGTLLRHYHKELEQVLFEKLGPAPIDMGSCYGNSSGDGIDCGSCRRGGGGGGEGDVKGGHYPYAVFMKDYRVAFLNYVRCVLGTLWRGLTLEKVEQNSRAGPGMSLVNRSLPHIRWIINRAIDLLDEE